MKEILGKPMPKQKTPTSYLQIQHNLANEHKINQVHIWCIVLNEFMLFTEHSRNILMTQFIMMILLYFFHQKC